MIWYFIFIYLKSQMLYFFPSSLGLPFDIEVALTMKRFTNIYLAKNTNNRSLAGLLVEVICEWLDGLYRFSAQGDRASMKEVGPCRQLEHHGTSPSRSTIGQSLCHLCCFSLAMSISSNMLKIQNEFVIPCGPNAIMIELMKSKNIANAFLYHSLCGLLKW